MKPSLTTILTAATLCLFTSAAFAAGCGDAPTAPSIPDGMTAKGDDMGKTSEAMEKYSGDMSTWRECTTKAMNTLTEEYGTTLKQWQTQLASYQERGKKKK